MEDLESIDSLALLRRESCFLASTVVGQTFPGVGIFITILVTGGAIHCRENKIFASGGCIEKGGLGHKIVESPGAWVNLVVFAAFIIAAG